MVPAGLFSIRVQQLELAFVLSFRTLPASVASSVRAPKPSLLLPRMMNRVVFLRFYQCKEWKLEDLFFFLPYVSARVKSLCSDFLLIFRASVV